MKRFLLLFFTLSLIFTGFSQENTSPLVVNEFLLKTNGIMDIEQVPKNARTDYDSNPVCMIQVKAVGFDENLMQKFIFASNGIDIMHKNIKDGMVLLYVSSNKIGDIIIKHMGDCTFTLPYKLEKNKIYTLTLGMESATLIIRAVPNTAEIYIDNEKVGTGYASKTVSIRAEHSYKVQCDGYWPVEDVAYFEKRDKKELDIKLVPNFSYITIKTDPAGADVTIDGEKVGITPYMSERIPFGQHRIELNKEGYEKFVEVLEIKPDELENTQLANVKLTKIYVPQQQTTTTTQTTVRQPVTTPSKPVVRTYTVGNVSFEMISVKGGTFTMGGTSEQGAVDDDEKPTHSVTLSDYYIGKYEVTQALWKAVMGNRPSTWKGENLPVESVSWKDVQDFIKKLNQKTGENFRLPTEAEWEYAARGGNKSKGYRFSGSNNIGDVAWQEDNSGKKTHPVGMKSPNELGIYDMSGNVWEWCEDKYGKYSSESQTNPTGSTKGSQRVLRGGSWSNFANICHISNRGKDSAGEKFGNYGFRLVIVP